jgi:ribonuclease R
MSDKIGDMFKALISGVTEWGIYAEIIDNKCEGMIRARDMHDDVYIYDEDNYRYVGKHHGKIYALGDTVIIVVKRADLLKKQLDFAFIDSELEMEPRNKKKKHRR